MGLRDHAARSTQTAEDVGEHTIISRAGGAPTLAVGMAQILPGVIGGKAMMAFWYHFAILFEALFILTAVDAGTRAGRFMLQDLLGIVRAGVEATRSPGRQPGRDRLCVAAWGFFLYQGVVDPLGGINTLWPLFGIANQMLAGVALILATVVLLRMKRERYAWVTILPSLAAGLHAHRGLQKILHADPRIGFLSHASRFAEAADAASCLRRRRPWSRCGRSSSTTMSTPALATLFVRWWCRSWSSASAPASMPGAPSAGPRRRSAIPEGSRRNDRAPAPPGSAASATPRG